MKTDRELLVQISACEVAWKHLCDPTFASDCSEIVTSQGAHDWNDFQVPEPWSGDLASAPILFLSSNPSISSTEAYPTGNFPRNVLIDFFTNRFDGYWIRNGVHPREKNGGYGAAVKYWSGIRNRASELLERQAVPGRDYTLTEIVHCKSAAERGVEAAIGRCAERYMLPLLSTSAARLIVLVGKKALRHFNSMHVKGLPLVPETNGTARLCVANRNRIFLYLGHPTGPEPKHFEDWITEARLDDIRAFLRAPG